MALIAAGLMRFRQVFAELEVMKSWVISVSGGRPHPPVKRARPGYGTSVMVVLPWELNQKRSVSRAIFLAECRFVASGIDLYDLSNECRAGENNRNLQDSLALGLTISKPEKLVRENKIDFVTQDFELTKLNDDKD